MQARQAAAQQEVEGDHVDCGGNRGRQAEFPDGAGGTGVKFGLRECKLGLLGIKAGLGVGHSHLGLRDKWCELVLGHAEILRDRLRGRTRREVGLGRLGGRHGIQRGLARWDEGLD